MEGLNTKIVDIVESRGKIKIDELAVRLEVNLQTTTTKVMNLANLNVVSYDNGVVTSVTKPLSFPSFEEFRKLK